MNDDEFSVLSKSRINGEAIIINQSQLHDHRRLEWNGNHIHCYSFNERGVGLSRNNALIRASAEIVLFGDNDIILNDDYVNCIIEEFKNNPLADIIIFNYGCISHNNHTMSQCRHKKIGIHNCLKYGAIRIAAKLISLRKANVQFSLLFGGGAKYSAGEDSLFLVDCLRKKLKIFESSKVIGTINPAESTWFKGYTEKYFNDKGAFYSAAFGRLSYIICLLHVIRHRNEMTPEIKTIKAIGLMYKGIREYINYGHSKNGKDE